MPVVVIPRTFGGTLLLTLAGPTSQMASLAITALFRDGQMGGVWRNGEVSSIGRDGRVQARSRDGEVSVLGRDGVVVMGGR